MLKTTALNFFPLDVYELSPSVPYSNLHEYSIKKKQINNNKK